MTCFVFQPKEQEHIYLFGFFTVNEFSVPGKKYLGTRSSIIVYHSCFSVLLFGADTGNLAESGISTFAE